MTIGEIIGNVAAGLIGLLLAAVHTEYRDKRRYRQAYEETIHDFNQFQQESRHDVECANRQPAEYEMKLRQQQDVIDQLTGQLSEVRRFHYN